MIRLALLSVALSLSPSVVTAQADEEDVLIVTTCHYGNAEWGTEMIHRCIDENRAQRAEVLSLPAEHGRAVQRCRQSAELGWAWVQACVQKDAQAGTALAAYPDTAAPLISAFNKEFAASGHTAVKDCVDRAMGSSPAK